MLGNISKYPADGYYWSVDGQPVHFNPPTMGLDRVREHYPQMVEAHRLTGAQWWALVKLLEMR